MKFIETRDGTKIHYVDYGDGAPVILIHGWPLSSAMWEHQLTELPKHGIRCIAYDRRGFGHSGATWNGYDYDTLASDLNDLLEQLDIRNATLAGFSMGGGEAVRYLSEFGTGGRVTKVALIAAVPPFMLKTNDNPNGVDASVFEEMVSGLTKDRADFLGGFSKKFYGVGILTSPVSDAQLEWDRTVALAASPRATLECVRSFSQTDFRKDLDAMCSDARHSRRCGSDRALRSKRQGNGAPYPRRQAAGLQGRAARTAHHAQRTSHSGSS
jgi:non-heme chloroperoxidase